MLVKVFDKTYASGLEELPLLDRTASAEFLDGLINAAAEFSPQVALCVALIQDAVWIINTDNPNDRDDSLRAETIAWFFCVDSDWTFSFQSICAALNLPPSIILKKLKITEQEKQYAYQDESKEEAKEKHTGRRPYRRQRKTVDAPLLGRAGRRKDQDAA